MNTLITAASTARAHRLKKELNTGDVILGDHLGLPDFMLSANMIRLPHPSSIAYAHEMLTLCLDKQISTVYALNEAEAVNLKQVIQLFEEYGIEIIPDTGNKL